MKKDKESIDWKRVGIAAALITTGGALMADQVVADLPNQNPNANNPAESTSSPESAQLYQGQVIQEVSQEVKTRLAAETGSPENTIGGFTISIDRSQAGLSTPLEVEFGVAPEWIPDPNGSGNMIKSDREHMFQEDLPNGKIQLYRKIIPSPNDDGNMWMQLGFYTFKGPVIAAEQPVLEYPANTNELHHNGQSVKMRFFPTEDMINHDLPGASIDKPITVVLPPKMNEVQANLSAPTPFSNQEVSSNNSVAPEPPTLVPASPEPTNTATPTEIPVKRYSCPISIEASNMSSLSLKEDIQSGELAKWARTLPGFSAPISADPSKIDFHISDTGPGGENTLSANSTDKPGWATIHSRVLGVCKINPREFGVEGKSDAFVIISVIQDKNNVRIPVFTLTGKTGLETYYYNGFLSGEKQAVSPRNRMSNTSNVVFILEGAEPGKQDDLRVLADHDLFYNAQDTTFGGMAGLDAVNGVFEKIEATDNFTPETIEFFEKNIFYSSKYKDLN